MVMSKTSGSYQLAYSWVETLLLRLLRQVSTIAKFDFFHASRMSLPKILKTALVS